MNYSFLLRFLKKIHLVIGLFIGPFIAIAAITGALYGLSFAIEPYQYKNFLFHSSRGERLSLDRQFEIAEKAVSTSTLYSIRPAATKDGTTQVLYQNPNLKSSEYETIFVDPIKGEVVGHETTYGSGGAMPLRRHIDYFHTNFYLESWGRWYSELAASWLWFLALTGIMISIPWIKRKKSTLINRHIIVGFVASIGMIMLSITGLTWSNWAGISIDKFRNHFNLITPSHHLTISPSGKHPILTFEKALEIGRAQGLSAEALEIVPSLDPNKAWVVKEIERKFPTKVDSIAINPYTEEVIETLHFKDFNWPTKLTRWGIDLHMGSMFGLINKIVLIAVCGGILYLIYSGYKLYFTKRSRISLIQEFKLQPVGNKIFLIMLLAVFLYWIPLAAFFIFLYSIGEIFVLSIQSDLKNS